MHFLKTTEVKNRLEATGDSGMPANTDEKVAETLKPMLKKRSFVAVSKATAPPEELLPFVGEHLAYMDHRERV
jgi:hypothetical protein